MARSNEEWVAKNDDQAIPTRVRLRVLLDCKGACANCERKIGTGEKWECDHIVALCNGGEHRETNLQVLCDWCHKKKTANDVALKSEAYHIQVKHFGVKKKPKGRALPGTRASGIRKRMDGTIERW